MNVLDRVRIERAVLAYDWWLDLRGTPWRRRRDLRRELRVNLREAAARTVAKTAVAALGSTRQMAAESGTVDPTRPRWSAGVSAGIIALLVSFLPGLLAATAWADGVMSADPDSPVRGSVVLLPGSALRYEPQADGFALSFTPGWFPLLVVVVVFAVVARPWRALRSREEHPAPLERGSTAGGQTST